jgi:hypothetical protein
MPRLTAKHKLYNCCEADESLQSNGQKSKVSLRIIGKGFAAKQ